MAGVTVFKREFGSHFRAGRRYPGVVAEESHTLNHGQAVIFDPPLPRCHYKGGTIVGLKEVGVHYVTVVAQVKLASGLVIAAYFENLRGVSPLELLALAAE